MYDYGIYEMYLNPTGLNSTTAEWAATLREETLEREQVETSNPESTSLSGLVAVVVVAGLLLGSIGAFVVGTLKVAEGAATLNQEIVSRQLGDW